MKTLLTLTLLTLLNFATLQTTLAGMPQDPPENVASAEQPPLNSAEFSREPNGLYQVLGSLVLGSLLIVVIYPGLILGMLALSFVCTNFDLSRDFCGSASSAENDFVFWGNVLFYTVLLLTLLRHKLRYLIQRLLGRQPVLPSKKLTRKEILSTILLFLFAVFLFKGLYILTLFLTAPLTQELALGEFLEIAAEELFYPTIFLLCYFLLKYLFLFYYILYRLLKCGFSKKT